MELEARDELDEEEAEDELEESFALFEPHALKAKMPATARDTHAVAFLVVIIQEFSRFCKYFYHKMHYTRVLHIKEIELAYISKLNFIYERIN